MDKVSTLPDLKNPEVRRMYIMKGKAKAFANMVDNENMAFLFPEDIVDWLRDNEFEEFYKILRERGLVQRKDLR